MRVSGSVTVLRLAGEPRIERVGRLERRQELRHLLLLRDGEGHVGVRQEVAVVAHHHRDAGGLRHAEGLQGVVDDLLVVAGVDLDPAGVALRDGVLVVVPDVPGSADGPVGHAHDDGQPRARGPVHLLVHVEQPVGAGGGESPRAGRARADADGQCRVLALYRDVPGVHLARLDELGELLGERRLRGDGIGGHHLDAGQLDAQRGCYVTGLDDVHGPQPSASFVVDRFIHHGDGLGGALLGADAAALAVLVVDLGRDGAGHHTVGAVEPAGEAGFGASFGRRAAGQVYDRALDPPRPGVAAVTRAGQAVRRLVAIPSSAHHATPTVVYS